MKDESKIKDWRSTGRRKARRALYEAYIEYKCVDCGKTSTEPPKDAPKWFDEIWPVENRVLDYPLQANHLTKDYTVNTVEFLEWLCVPCHKKKDAATEKGVSTVSEIPDIWGERMARTIKLSIVKHFPILYALLTRRHTRVGT